MQHDTTRNVHRQLRQDHVACRKAPEAAHGVARHHARVVHDVHGGKPVPRPGRVIRRVVRCSERCEQCNAGDEYREESGKRRREYVLGGEATRNITQPTWCNLDGACAHGHVHENIVEDDRNRTAVQWVHEVPAVQRRVPACEVRMFVRVRIFRAMLTLSTASYIPGVVGMHGHGDVAVHGLGPCCRDHNLALSVCSRERNVVDEAHADRSVAGHDNVARRVHRLHVDLDVNASQQASRHKVPTAHIIMHIYT